MLRKLYISNYALISELHISFDNGFTVITGETGAGKSIIIGALSLILGQRAETKSIKTESEKCIIEAEFDISAYQHLNDFFATNELDNDGSHCIIRRELIANGKSRAFINDTPVSLNIIRDLSTRLIDIHSQHENLLLSNGLYQLEVVDTIAQNLDLQSEYRTCFDKWRELQSEYRKLQQFANKQAADLDYIQFQYQQLSDANLIAEEQHELELELDTLTHAEEIKSELQKVIHLLGDEQAVLPLIKDAVSALSKVHKYLPNGNILFERIQSSYVELKDLLSENEAIEERVDFNPERLLHVESRLSELFVLQKKYRVNTVAELIAIRDEFEQQLQRIESFDEEIENLQIQIKIAHTALEKAAINLTESRKSATKPIESYLIEQLTKLGMPNIQFEVAITAKNELDENGADDVQFLFSANKNRALQPVQLIASGGEISRLMLSIKSLIAHKSDLPTIIFDEIDTGVSGEIAHRMGEIMAGMSVGMQVITITHLPQIAAKGNQHYRVYKNDEGEQTQTHIEILSENNRLTELAQMLSGKEISEAALDNAKALMRK